MTRLGSFGERTFVDIEHSCPGTAVGVELALQESVLKCDLDCSFTSVLKALISLLTRLQETLQSCVRMKPRDLRTYLRPQSAFLAQKSSLTIESVTFPGLLASDQRHSRSYYLQPTGLYMMMRDVP